MLKLEVEHVSCSQISPDQLAADSFDEFKNSLPAESSLVALAATYTPDRQLSYLLFVHAGNQGIRIELPPPLSPPASPADTPFQNTLQSILDGIHTLCSHGYIAYDAECLASALFLDYGVRLPSCYHIQVESPGITEDVISFNRKGVLKALFDDDNVETMLGRAVGALKLGDNYLEKVTSGPVVNTMHQSAEVLRVAAGMFREIDVLERVKLNKWDREIVPASAPETRAILRGILSGSCEILQNNKLLTTLYDLPPLLESSEDVDVPVPRKLQKGRGIFSTLLKDLNDDQRRAILEFCTASASADNGPVMRLVQGGPGTGKSLVLSTIARLLAAEPGEVVFVVAETDVELGIVVGMMERGGFEGLKVVVADDDDEENGRLYRNIASNVVLTSEIPDSSDELDSMFDGIRVLLCTLSLLTSPKFNHSGLSTSILRPTTLLVDNANSIPLMSYWPAFARFEKTLTRVGFFGDPKQLRPYARQFYPSVQTVFKLEHMTCKHLSIQYRMPLVLSNFLSRMLYWKNLTTDRDHPLSNTSAQECVRLVDVVGEETNTRSSYQNAKEAICCMTIARQLVDAQKDWKIVTGYDAQKALIEDCLKGNGLPWENRVFTIDGSQGQQADFIIISLVRMNVPGVLEDDRKANMMLSRCRLGMAIVGRVGFLTGKGRRSLVGKLVNSLELQDSAVLGADVVGGQSVFESAVA